MDIDFGMFDSMDDIGEFMMDRWQLKHAQVFLEEKRLTRQHEWPTINKLNWTRSDIWLRMCGKYGFGTDDPRMYSTKLLELHNKIYEETLMIWGHVRERCESRSMDVFTTFREGR